MIKGLYSAFTAMDAAWRHQDVLANNIANANTVGFKREVGATGSFDDIMLRQQAGVPAPLPARIQSIVGQIGTGSFMAEFSTDFANGDINQTGQELDLALEQGFFAVQGEGGEVFYTRAGRFQRDADGAMVTATGLHVLGADGQPITLGIDPVSIASDGTIESGGQQIARLQIVNFEADDLRRAGEAFFAADVPGTDVAGGVRQGFLEGSNTDMSEEMTSLMAVQRTFQANQTLIARYDETLQMAAGQLGTWGR